MPAIQGVTCADEGDIVGGPILVESPCVSHVAAFLPPS